MHRNRAIPLLAAAILAALTGCSTVQSHWPFGKKEAPVPQPVRELAVQVPESEAMPVVLQFWERNTLVIDLQGAPSTGHLTLVPEPGHTWPARLAFRMSPVRFQQLDVSGDQRVLLPVAAGPDATTAELPPGVLGSTTAKLELRWGASATN